VAVVADEADEADGDGDDDDDEADGDDDDDDEEEEEDENEDKVILMVRRRMTRMKRTMGDEVGREVNEGRT
jgi:hypothetical protein